MSALNTAEDEKRRVAARWALSGRRADAMAKRKSNIRQLHDHELELERALTDLLAALEAMPSRNRRGKASLIDPRSASAWQRVKHWVKAVEDGRQ
jgi:hypothetical protein